MTDICDDCDKFLSTIYDQGMDYHKKAEYYRNNGELEGALINYLLSTSNLYNWRLYDNESGYKKKKNKEEEIQHLAIQTEINNTLTKNMQYIVPLQEKLKQIKKNRNCPEDDKNDTKCTDVSTIKRGSIRFDDISGQVSAKEQIKQGILYPLLFPKLYPYLSKGILFYGPPGTGKTLLAKAFANELQSLSIEYNMNVKVLFYAPEGGQLKGKYVGETEKNIEKYFNCASKQASACQSDPDLKKGKLNPCNLPEDNSKVISVIFLDEVEAIAGDRSRDTSGLMTNSVNALLQKMDGVNSLSNVVVMAATNYPWSLDDAILRRFDTKIYITLPTRTDVINLIKIDIAKYIKKILFYDTPPPSKKPADNGDLNMEGDCNPSKCPGQICCGGVCLHSDSNTSTEINNDDIFNFYRKLYFPSLSDTQLQNIADLYVKNNFSGGDISNALKAVFRDMGKTAFDQKKWIETQIEKYTNRLIGSKKYIEKPGEASVYKFSLYSNNAKRSDSNDDNNSRFPDTEFALWFRRGETQIDLQSDDYKGLFTLDNTFHLNSNAYTSKIKIPKTSYATQTITETFNTLSKGFIGGILTAPVKGSMNIVQYLTKFKSHEKKVDDGGEWFTQNLDEYKNMHAAIASYKVKNEVEKNRSFYDISIRNELDFLYINWQIFYSDLYANPNVFKNLITRIITLRSGNDEPKVKLCSKTINAESLKLIQQQILKSNETNSFKADTQLTKIDSGGKNLITNLNFYPNPSSWLNDITCNIGLQLDLIEYNINIMITQIQQKNVQVDIHDINRTWFIEYTHDGDKKVYYPAHLNDDVEKKFTEVKDPKYKLDINNNIYKFILIDPFKAFTLSHSVTKIKTQVQMEQITGIFSGICIPRAKLLGGGAEWTDCVYFDLGHINDTLKQIQNTQLKASDTTASKKWEELDTFSKSLDTHIKKLTDIRSYIEDKSATLPSLNDQFDISYIDSIKKEYNTIASDWDNKIENDETIKKAVEKENAPKDPIHKAAKYKQAILTNCKEYEQGKLIEKMYYHMNKLINEEPVYIVMSNIIGRVNSLCAYFNTANNTFIEWRKFIDYVYKMYDGNHAYKKTTSINILVKMDVSPSLVKTVLKKYTIDGRIYLEFTFNPYKDYYNKSINCFESMKQSIIEMKNYFTTKTDDEQLTELLEIEVVENALTESSTQKNGYDTEIQNTFDSLISISEQNQNSPDIFETLFLRSSNIISYNPTKIETKHEIKIDDKLQLFEEKCYIMNDIFTDSNIKVDANDIKDFSDKLKISKMFFAKNIDIFNINEEFYRNPKYITFMRAICHLYCDISITELLEIGKNHTQLMDIMISKTSGDKYNMDIVNVKDYMYQNDAIQKDDGIEPPVNTFLKQILKLSASWGIINIIKSILGACNMTTSFLSSNAIMTPIVELIGGITSTAGGIISTGTTWVSTTTAYASVSSGAAWLVSTGAAVVSSPWAIFIIATLVLTVFTYYMFKGYKSGFRNVWNRYFDDKHKKFRLFKLCLMNNKLFGAECGFGTNLASKINNRCKSNEKTYYNSKFINCKAENNFTILPELVTETISIAPYIGRELYGEKYYPGNVKMYRYMDTGYKKYRTVATPTLKPGGFFQSEYENVQRSRNNKNSNRKSVNKRNRNTYQSGGAQSTPTNADRITSAQCPKATEMGSKNTEAYITLDFHPKMFMKVCSADNPLKIKGTIDKCKISILDKYHSTGSITEDERANKCNTTEKK